MRKPPDPSLYPGLLLAADAAGNIDEGCRAAERRRAWWDWRSRYWDNAIAQAAEMIERVLAEEAERNMPKERPALRVVR